MNDLPSPKEFGGVGPVFWTRSLRARVPFLAVCTILSTVCLSMPGQSRAQEKVGYVLDMHGSWALAGDSQCLKRGDTVLAGALLRNTAAKASDGDRIVIADLKGDVIKKIRCKSSVCNECRSSGTCYDPIQPLPQVSPSPSVLRTSFEGLMALFSSKPERFSVHRVRGETVADTVAQLSADRVYLGQVLTGLKNEHYDVTFIRIADGGQSFEWKQEQVTIAGEHVNTEQIVISGIRPGLYEAKLDAGDFSRTFWVLFVDTESYSKLNSEFRRMSIQMDTWGDDVPADLKDSYRRAYLAYLDKQVEAKSATRIQ